MSTYRGRQPMTVPHPEEPQPARTAAWGPLTPVHGSQSDGTSGGRMRSHCAFGDLAENVMTASELRTNVSSMFATLLVAMMAMPSNTSRRFIR